MQGNQNCLQYHRSGSRSTRHRSGNPDNNLSLLTSSALLVQQASLSSLFPGLPGVSEVLSTTLGALKATVKRMATGLMPRLVRLMGLAKLPGLTSMFTSIAADASNSSADPEARRYRVDCWRTSPCATITVQRTCRAARRRRDSSYPPGTAARSPRRRVRLCSAGCRVRCGYRSRR